MTRDDLGTATIIRGNALALPLPDDSVDLVVTSPPYFGLRSYQDGGEHYDGQLGAEPTPAEFVDALIAATAEAMRVLKPSGSMWVNLGDKYGRGSRPAAQPAQTIEGRDRYRPQLDRPENLPNKSLLGIPWRYAIRCTDDLRLTLRAEVVWSKPNGMPEKVTDRVRRSHETWFHFTKRTTYYSSAPEDGVPGSVWTIPTEPLTVPDSLGVAHFAAYPTEWPRRIIAAWCPPGGTVLDPFGGTGTTALVAKALGRDGVSVDLSADYCRLAEWRTNDRDQLGKVLGLAKVEAESPDQLDLFATA